MTFKVGDQVRLTGPKWKETEGVPRDLVTTVREVNPSNPKQVIFSFEDEDEDEFWHLNRGWEVELISGNSEEAIENRASMHDDYLNSFEQSVRYHTNKIADLLIAKNKAYGDSALNPVRIFSKASRIEQLNVRIDDKISRIQRGTDFGDEDTVRDLIGYLVLRLIAEESE